MIRSDAPLRPAIVARGVVVAPGPEGGILCRMRQYDGRTYEGETELTGFLRVEPTTT